MLAASQHFRSVGKPYDTVIYTKSLIRLAASVLICPIVQNSVCGCVLIVGVLESAHRQAMLATFKPNLF